MTEPWAKDASATHQRLRLVFGNILCNFGPNLLEGFYFIAAIELEFDKQLKALQLTTPELAAKTLHVPFCTHKPGQETRLPHSQS